MKNLSRLIYKSLPLASLVFIVSCSTTPKKQNVVLPVTIEGLFATCNTGDGAVNLQVYDKNAMRGSGDLEWIADFNRGWRSELINPLGRSLLSLSYDERKKTFTQSGGLANYLPPLRVEDGFIEVDGYFVGLMPSEVPCFLKFRLPRNWLPYVHTFEQAANSVRMTIIDDHRTIHTEITGTQPELTSKICSTITWSVFLGMVNRSMTICNELTGTHSGYLKGLDEFSIRWVDIDR